MELDATNNMEVDPNAGVPAVSIAGTVRTTDGGAVPEGLMLLLDPLDGGSGQMQQRTPAPKGQFRFETITPGTWALTAFSNTGQTVPVVAVSAGGVSSAGNQITVKDHPVTVTVAVSRAQNKVKGFARKNVKPAPGVMVLLVPRDPSAYRALLRRDQSDSDGSFLLRDVPAGRYTVVAIEEGWKLNWQEPAVIARFLPRGVSVTVNDRPDAFTSLSEPVPVSPR
jgi:hypothetical protein